MRRSFKSVVHVRANERTAAFVALYTLHRDNPGTGCLFAAVGSEAARQSSPIRRVFAGGFKKSVELVSRLMPGKSEKVRRKQALATYASLVGGLILSRAADDPALSEEILEAVKESISLQ